ncbi:MAG: hypothetical protein PHV34_20925 [Verrucomicrobiae bacterium]|nr:hypothetical protein [Verrucomicrobiae bacterium]
MTAMDALGLVSGGEGRDFQAVLEICRRHGSFCFIGGLAVNSYVEPVYTMDADIVMIAPQWDELKKELLEKKFTVSDEKHSINARLGKSQLSIQFTKDPRYQAFPSRAQVREVLGQQLPVAALPDLVQGKLWAYQDPARRLSKREKDRLDLIRIAEKYPEHRKILPPELQQLFAKDSFHSMDELSAHCH